MDSAITDEILEELSSVLQKVEAQSAAILEFIKEKGIANEDELAPYLQRANEASSVRWRATRVRLAHLLSGLEKRDQQSKDNRSQKEKHERQEKAQQSVVEKTSEPQPAELEKNELPAAQKPNHLHDNQNRPQAPRAIQSPKSDVSGAQESHAPESRPKDQEPSKTSTAKEPEKPTDHTDRRDAA